MVTKFRKTCWLIVLALLVPPLQVFASSKEYRGQVRSETLDVTNDHIYCQTLSEKEFPEVEKICLDHVDVKYRLHILLGEPIGEYSVAWTAHPYLYSRKRGESRKIKEMSAAVQQAFRNLVPVSPTKFALTCYTPGGYQVVIPFDAGALKRSGEGDSFNTPGSPSWNQFIARTNGFDSFFGAASAKKFYLQLDGCRFWTIKNLTFSGVGELNAAIRGEKTYPLAIRIKTSDSNTSKPTIRILNSKETYRDGIALKAGDYHIEVTQSGLPPKREWIHLDEKHTSFTLSLGSPAPQQNSLSASLLILLDISGSMAGNKLSSAKQAAVNTIKQALRNHSEVAVLAFEGDCSKPISRQIDFTVDESALATFVQSLKAGGGTPLSGALAAANRYMQRGSNPNAKNKMIILLADGDNSCGDINQTMDQLHREGINYKHETVGLEISTSSNAAQQLKSIASQSGGSYHYASDHRQLDKVFQEAFDTMSMLDMLGQFGSGATTDHSGRKTAPSNTQNILNSF